jgi:hypothetical protein
MQMSQTRQNVKSHLVARWSDKVRETDKGFKLNADSLNNEDIHYLECVPANVKYTIRRSGTGLVVIII